MALRASKSLFILILSCIAISAFACSMDAKGNPVCNIPDFAKSQVDEKTAPQDRKKLLEDNARLRQLVSLQDQKIRLLENRVKILEQKNVKPE